MKPLHYQLASFQPHSEQLQRFCNIMQHISERDIDNFLASLEALKGIPVEHDTPMKKSRGTPLLEKITSREQEILILIANGYTRRDISNTLGITVHTAASHIHHIYQKLSISSVAEATQLAISEGLLQSARNVG